MNGKKAEMRKTIFFIVIFFAVMFIFGMTANLVFASSKGGYRGASSGRSFGGGSSGRSYGGKRTKVSPAKKQPVYQPSPQSVWPGRTVQPPRRSNQKMEMQIIETPRRLPNSTSIQKGAPVKKKTTAERKAEIEQKRAEREARWKAGKAQLEAKKKAREAKIEARMKAREVQKEAEKKTGTLEEEKAESSEEGY